MLPRRLMAIWVCFLARLLFYCVMLPLWEGYDEWSHFAVIRHVAAGELLAPRDAVVQRDVEESFYLAPVPWEMRHLNPPVLTHDNYWRLPAQARAAREHALGAMPSNWQQAPGPGFTAYEALQPPLYYWILAPVLWLFSGAGLVAQVMLLRWVSALIGSLIVPLVFLVADEVFEEKWTAYGCAAVVAVMPGLAVDLARVANDCLAIVLFTLLSWLAVRAVKQGLDRKLALCIGLTLGAGLLTKAYFLTAVPAVGFLVLWSFRKRAAIGHALLSAGVAVAVSGWWYVRNIVTTGTLSGLSEAVMLRGLGTAGMIGKAASVPWLKAVDSILLSHLYFGGWSSLQVRSWMYHALYVVIAIAAIGALRLLREREVAACAAVYAAFWAGQLYNVVLLFASKGLPGSMGWYLYAVVGVEVVLCVAGLVRVLPAKAAAMAASMGVTLFALLDLYTVHAIAIPYYTGMIRHRTNDALASLHLADFQQVGFDGAFARLAAFKSGLAPETVIIVLWVFYLCATAYLLRKWGGGAKAQD